MGYIFSWTNFLIGFVVAMVCASAFTYTIPGYWVNVAGIMGTSFILQMLGLGIYNVWTYFTKS